MKLKASIIESAINNIDIQLNSNETYFSKEIIACNEQNIVGQVSDEIALPLESEISDLTYNELKSGIDSMYKINAGNLNSMVKKQNLNYPEINECFFDSFRFGSGNLLVKYKVSFLYPVGTIDNSSIIISWNGKTFNIY